MAVDISSIQRKELRDLLQAWQSRRHDRGPPLKSRFAPVDVAEQLSNMMFVEVEPGRRPRFRYREVGVDLLRIYGEDVTDRYLHEMPRLFRTFAEPAYREVVNRRDATHGSFRFVENWWIATYERLMLPLVDPDGLVVEVAVGLYPRIQARRSA
jgi:hypothetical protein